MKKRPQLEAPPHEEPKTQVVDPDIVLAAALAEAEALRIQAELARARANERETPRDMSPLGSRY